jgi:hypothetical protein
MFATQRPGQAGQAADHRRDAEQDIEFVHAMLRLQERRHVHLMFQHCKRRSASAGLAFTLVILFLTVINADILIVALGIGVLQQETVPRPSCL